MGISLIKLACEKHAKKHLECLEVEGLCRCVGVAEGHFREIMQWDDADF